MIKYTLKPIFILQMEDRGNYGNNLGFIQTYKQTKTKIIYVGN